MREVSANSRRCTLVLICIRRRRRHRLTNTIVDSIHFHLCLEC